MKSFRYFQQLFLICGLLFFVSACSEKTVTTESVVVTPSPAPEPNSEPAEIMDEVEEEDPFEEFELDTDDEVPPPPTADAVAAIAIDAKARLPKFLSEYNLFKDPAKQIPNAGLVPYYLNTGHFADGAEVSRYMWLPPGEKIAFDPTGRFSFPAGTLLLQTFSYPDKNNADARRLVETRILLNQPGKGWSPSSYKWDETNSNAKKAVAGGLVPVSYVSESNEAHEFKYLIPNKNDCKRCHENEEVVYALGLTARNLNRDVDYGDGLVNQLTHWIDRGLIEGAPEDLASIEKGLEWDDPDSGTLEKRAREWLDVNCAHCHNPKGAGAVSGLDLTRTQENPVRWGAFKPPVAAGRGSEGLRFSIDPGSANTSFMIRRLLSKDPSVMMPPVGRMTADTEGAALVAEWIESLTFTEDEAKEMIAAQEAALKILQEQAALEAANQ